MKKVRIMLSAIAILGVVGGALAFKAKTYGQNKYCYKSVLAPGNICTASLTQSTFKAGNEFRYTITTIPALCTNGVITCPLVGVSAPE